MTIQQAFAMMQEQSKAAQAELERQKQAFIADIAKRRAELERKQNA